MELVWCRFGGFVEWFCLGDLVGFGIEGGFDDLGREFFVADIDGEGASGFGVLGKGGDIADPDGLLEAGGKAARSEDADLVLPVCIEDLVAVSGDTAIGELDANEAAGRFVLDLFKDGIASEEGAFFRLDGPAQSGLDRVGGLIDIVAVEGITHLHAQRVACAKADGCGSFVDQRVPESGGFLGGDEDLETIFACVSRTSGHTFGDTREGGGGELVVLERREVGGGEGVEHRTGLWALDRDQRPFVAIFGRFHHEVGFGFGGDVFLEPSKVFVAV